MIKDYAKRLPKSAAGRRNMGRGQGDDGKVLKAVGLIVVSAMLVGVAVSFWLGWKIRTDLDALSRDSRIRKQLTVVNRSLTAERDELLTDEKIEAAAAGIGLFRPTVGQIRRP